MPAKNAADTIAESLTSILTQELREFELLVIDDGSTDQTREIIQHFATQDSRVKYTCSFQSGIVAALNLGLQQASSDIIARMDADDLMHPQRLSAQYDYLSNHPETCLVASQAELFPEKNIKTGYREYMRWQNSCLSHDDIYNDIYLESPFAHPSVMFRNTVIQSIGAYRSGLFPEDYDLWLRMASHGCRFHKLAKVHIGWRESVSRTSRKDPRYAREAFDRLRAEYLIKDERLCGDRPIVVWGAGRRTRKRVSHILTKGIRVVMWIDVDPNKIGNKINGAWVRPPEALLINIKISPSESIKPFVLCYVSNHGARQEIAAQLNEYGYQRGYDYLMVG